MATPRVSFTTPYFGEAAAATANKVEAIPDLAILSKKLHSAMLIDSAFGGDPQTFASKRGQNTDASVHHALRIVGSEQSAITSQRT